MGYESASNFLTVANYGVRPGSSVCELGDQTVELDDANINILESFFSVLDRPFDANKYISRKGQRIHTSEIYRDAGVKYVSLDLNSCGGAIPIDLNVFTPEITKVGQFDVVTNFGTTEHVGNQLDAFATMHYLTKPGGVMWHQVPIIHYSAHALSAITPYFLKLLIDANGYEILTAHVKSADISRQIAFHYDPSLAFLSELREVVERSTLGALANVLLRKDGCRYFIPPLDIASDRNQVKNTIYQYVERYALEQDPAKIQDAVDFFYRSSMTPTEKLVSTMKSSQTQYYGFRVDLGRNISRMFRSRLGRVLRLLKTKR